MWRPDDQQLLERLEERTLMRALWRRMSHGAPPPSERAAGLVHLLRQTDEGARACERALDGEIELLVTLVRPASYVGLRPPLVHHLALWHHAVARTLPPHARGEAEEAWLQALGAWAALASESAYLRGLAEAVVADALPAAERDAVAVDGARRLLAELEERALEGAGALDDVTAISLSVFARVPEALARVEAPPATLASEAVRRRRHLVDATMRPVHEALTEAQARTEPGEAHLAALAAAVRVWRFTAHDLELERFVVDQATPMAWELYGHKQWSMLRRLDATIAPAVDALAERVGRDPDLFAYASRVAQMLVFRAELLTTLDTQLETVERALVLCDTHRNGRLVCADLLSERALRRIETAPLWDRKRAALEARVDTRRAESLFAGLARTKRAKEAIAREGVEP
ncbi:MAG: hypothetical protein H6722_18670 [Sandaracinus sp.]|nr:hypothetical protein [Sandaracinus sp.]MCB9619429.1 hypothetical protein [Sandaracinus sp.]MCB9621849.1 hypothetical protein [Sandaracinus sp.]